MTHLKTDTDLNALKNRLHFSEIRMGDLVKVLEEMKTTVRLNHSEFNKFMKEVLNSARIQVSDQEFKTACNDLFKIFDQDGNNVVDWDEMIAGCSLLVGGGRKERFRILFELFDKDKNGLLTIKELFFLFKSSFHMLLVEPKMREIIREDNETLAYLTSRKCFMDLKVDNSGSIDFLKFESWMTKAFE